MKIVKKLIGIGGILIFLSGIGLSIYSFVWFCQDRTTDCPILSYFPINDTPNAKLSLIILGGLVISLLGEKWQNTIVNKKTGHKARFFSF
jgi:hypothetical protein